MRILGCVMNAHHKQMIHPNSWLIIPESPRMFWLGHQTGCVVLEIIHNLCEWLGVHANRIGPANGGALLYRKNGCSGGGRRGPTKPTAHIRRQTGTPPGASPNAHRCDHRGGGVLRWERTHRGWKGSVSPSARCDDEYKCLRPSTYDVRRKVHSGKVKEMETDCLSCHLVLVSPDETKWDWREREERDGEAMKEDGRKSESET
ncbi:hypothetical protein B0H14DRAFT_2836080 [Mycena olivaceomarginata]|nr:hypothetical protein B0H14DRAFT_2836080 [Mycena olivaceomarginata]